MVSVEGGVGHRLGTFSPTAYARTGYSGASGSAHAWLGNFTLPKDPRFGAGNKMIAEAATTHDQRVTDYLSPGELRTLLGRSLKYLFRPRPKMQIMHELPPGNPLVSVIIPTYHRSNVLRIA